MSPFAISLEQARRFLAAYHFTPTDLPGVRLGTVQYDPLKPVGRNADHGPSGAGPWLSGR